jgi:hypothetical protein
MEGWIYVELAEKGKQQISKKQIPKNKSQKTNLKIQRPNYKNQLPKTRYQRPYMNFGEKGEGLKRKPAVSSALYIVI